MITIKEIAQRCEVSTATVSYILSGKSGKASEKTRERVLRVARELDYVPNAAAQHLKSKRTRSIGVIVEDMTIFSIPEIVDGITDYCEQQDYQILLLNLRLFKKFNDSYYYKTDYFERVRGEIRKLMNKQVEAVIYVSAHERILRCIPEDLSIPAVMTYGYTKSSRVPSVVVDDVQGSYMITKRLLDSGHRRIGVITGKPDSLHTQARQMGFQKALYESFVPFHPEDIRNGDWERHSGYAQTDLLLSNGVTAIFCMNDLMAGGVYDRLEELGMQVGRDVSLAGYDDRMLSAYYQPGLTTVRLPLHDIGYEASRLILDMLENKRSWDEPYVLSVPCELVERASVCSYREQDGK